MLKHTIWTFFPALFLLWGRGMGQEIRNPVLIPQLETEEEETCRGSKREDRTTSIAYHFYSALTIDQVRDLWLLFCQMRSCRNKLVFLQVTEFNQLRRGSFTCTGDFLLSYLYNQKWDVSLEVQINTK